MFKVKFTLSFLLLTLSLCLSAPAVAQNSAFTYQGKLTDSGNLANGTYDFQFKLFDTQTVGTGTQQGTTVGVSNVTITNGIFTVQLDFGACPTCFDGTARFLEIAVKLTSGSTFTTLGPRQPITPTPYALGLSLACVSCVTSNQIGSVNGSAVTGTIPVTSVPAGSGNYIQNQNAATQTGDFNISGNGTANILNATTRYNLNGQQVLSAPGDNLFVGLLAGAANPTGFSNAFFGSQAGRLNTSGNNNAFFGSGSGTANTTGSSNAFFGSQAGQQNTSGNNNAFFGSGSGTGNTTGGQNAFFGSSAGAANQIGAQNAFFGTSAGQANINGGGNAFFGTSAGAFNTTGNNNAFFGNGAGVANTASNFNAFFGAFAGSANTGHDNAFFGSSAGNKNTAGINNTFIGSSADFDISNPTGNQNTLLGAASRVTSGVTNATAIGSGAQVTQSNSLVLGNNVNVGIGTTAPTERLHVVGNGLFTGNLTVNGTLNATLPAGSANYIQNQTAASQIGDFNISGNGTLGGTLAAHIVNADGYNINGQPVLRVVGGADCLFVGFNAGSTGSCMGNSFVGAGTGSTNTSGFHNSYFGSNAGAANTSGANNSFFGYLAGQRNTSGDSNAFFGSVAGFRNTVGQNNTFIGEEADFNTSSPTGDNNTLLGFNANVNSGVNNGTAIGANTSVTQSNSLVLGGITGFNSGTDTKVGIGTTTPAALLDVQRDQNTIPETARFTTYGNTNNLLLGRQSNGTRLAPTATTSGRVMLQLGATGHDGTDFATTARASIQLIASEDWTPTAQGTNIRFLTTANGTVTTSTRLFIRDDGNVGIGTTAPLDKLDVNGDIRVGTGTTGCVKDSDGTVIAGNCSSDARLKRAITPFPHLLDKLVQLQPVTFYWRSEEFKDRHFGTKPSFGLIAQEVEKVLPELVTEDEQGYKAVNYSKLPLVSLQAIKELKAENDTIKQKLSEQQALTSAQQQQLNQQQAQLAIQQQQLTQQQQEMAAVKKLLCASQPQADLCKVKSVK